MSADTPNATKGSGTSWVGRSIRRLEDPVLLRGEGRFTGDLPAKNWVRFVRSPVAAGKLRGIKKPEGAVVVTAADIKDVKLITPILEKFDYRIIGQPVLASDVVRYVGETVAAVVAPTPEEAEDLAELVELDIEEATPLVDSHSAIALGAPQVHPEIPGNVIVEGRVDTPDFDKVWASAHKIITVEARSHRQNASPMEGRAGHAAYDATTGRVVFHCTSQMPHMARTAIADLLGMPESDLRLIAPDVGGGFGQKMQVFPEYVALVWLARKYRSSFAWTEDRRENLIAGCHSRDQHVTLQGAYDASGKLIAIKSDILANIGAYSCFPTTCAVEPMMTLMEMPGCYDVRNYRGHTRGIVSHTCPVAPYRGVSRPVVAFVLERMMDKAARAFGVEPPEIRRRNLIDKFPYTSITNLVFDEASYRETLEIAVREIDLPAFRARQKEALGKGRYLGIGFSTFSERTGYGSAGFAARGLKIVTGWETVVVSIDPSGFVEARIGSSPHGQGLRTTLAQIVADEIGVDPQRVRVIHGDTDRAPYGWGTFASRSLVIGGGAAMLAAQKVRAKLIKLASHMLEADAADIVLEDNMAKVAGTDRSVSVAEIAREVYHRAFQFGEEVEPGISESATYDPPGTFSNACHVAIAEVDIETGKVTLEKFLVAEDAGRIINPMIADGQVHGGVAQGIGNALLEEIVYDETGNHLSTTFADYMPPTCHEIPPFELHHIETHTSHSITKAKGLGEGGTIGAPAAVVNAINDALAPFNVEIDHMPASPQRIRAALRESKTKSGDKSGQAA